MGRVELWVPVVGKGTEADPYRPDVPAGVAFTTNEGIPCDLDAGSARHGAPVNAYAAVLVAERDADKVLRRVSAASVPERERVLVDCLRMRREPAAVEARLARAALGTLERSAVVKQLGLRDMSVARG